ncbi:endonuclease exonuclease phosphatase [Thermoanaerobacterium thermosaccharolyticum]|uniref:Endonuclease exonuclease phosphatase n=1 Tax=Thermoanaerobacterium thermosaccharolyticum TaxID=1517 RepID=A0A223I2U2_THETR|nr:endonuclease exonuclease phosphatase [Thermoanaerobacterium thermosaccharolyticum]
MSKVNSSENRSFLLVCVDFGSSYFYVGTAHLGLNGVK